MATKKSSKKSAGKKQSAKKASSGPGKKKPRKKPEANGGGNPPVILGGGGSIVIYSDQQLVVPGPGEVPALSGYPYVLVYPDRTQSPRHLRCKRGLGGPQNWRQPFNPAFDLAEVQTS